MAGARAWQRARRRALPEPLLPPDRPHAGGILADQLAPPPTRPPVALERFRGTRGTIINPHRAIATIRLTRGTIVFAILLSVGTSAGFFSAIPAIGAVWAWAFDHLASPLGFTQGVGRETIDVGSFLTFQLPYFNAAAAAPSAAIWWTTLIVTIIVAALSFLIRDAFLPLAYALRLAAMVQGTALLFFAIAPDAFPYTLSEYIVSMEVAALAVLALVPVVLGFTYYVMDVRTLRKIGLTAAVIGHLLAFVPLQYALQSYVIAHASLLFLPLGLMLFGLLPEVMIFIAFYGWGMSWRPRQSRGRRE